MEDHKIIESLKCVKCNSRPVFAFQYSKIIKANMHKPYLSNAMAFTRTYYRRLVPVCKACQQDFNKWNKLTKIYKIVNWLGRFSLIFGLSFFLLTFLSLENQSLRSFFLCLFLFGVGMVIFSLRYKLILKRKDINPNKYLQYNPNSQLLEINSQGDCQWMPYDSWLQNALDEKPVS